MKYILVVILGLLISSFALAETNREVYVFSTDWCLYCKLLKIHILSDDRVIKSLEDYKLRYIDTDKHRDILPEWQIRTIPEIVIADRINKNKAIIVTRWKLRNMKENDSESYERNIQSLLEVLKKNSPKKD